MYSLLVYCAEILPRQVLCFCSVCVWRAPEGSLDRHGGYDIRFAGELIIRKENDEFFHVVAGDEKIDTLGPQEQVTVEVCLIKKECTHVSTVKSLVKT